MRWALLLPGLFLIVVVPIAAWVLSGSGTEMSPLLLYPFASPWWVFFTIDYTDAAEKVTAMGRLRLITGCAINAILLGCIGWLLDKRRR